MDRDDLKITIIAFIVALVIVGGVLSHLYWLSLHNL